MILSEFKAYLQNAEDLNFKLPNGTDVPKHFHVTEVGESTKSFIDCGGTVRSEKVVNFQLWCAEDYEHRLTPERLLTIITLSEDKINIGNHQIEVEYQGNTIGKYALEYNNENLVLEPKHTNCLAFEECALPAEKQKVVLSNINNKAATTSCTPGGGCC